MELSLVATGLLALAGFSAGFVDAIAGGGGILSLPALLAVGLPPHLALGTNKLQASLGTSVAATNYARRGLLTRSELPLAVACTAAGALAGALLVTRRATWSRSRASRRAAASPGGSGSPWPPPTWPARSRDRRSPSSGERG